MVAGIPELSLIAPLSGPVVALESTPDAVFSQKMMGDGLAIDPVSSTLVAPCDGEVSLLHASGHAVTITAATGAEILLHIGIDTVSLGGRGFTPHVAQGARVRAGDRLISFDADAVARAVPCLQTVIVVVNGDAHEITWRAAGAVEASTSRLMTVRSRAASAATGAATGAAELSATATVRHRGGIHARPAAIIRAAAAAYTADVTISYGGRDVSARSVISLMTLAADEGARLVVCARGDGAAAALAAVVAAIESDTPGGHATASAPPARRPAPARRADGSLGGVSAAPGIAVGRAVRLDQLEDVGELPARGAGVPAERARLDGALASVGGAITAAIATARVRGATAEADIFAAHQALLDDPDLIASARAAIDEGAGAGIAYRGAVRVQCDLLAASGSALLAERITDLRELERRVLRAVSGIAERVPELPPDSIVIADDIGPSELTRLPRARLAGLCTARGGATSHVAILARAMGIPALVAVGAELFTVPHGAEVLLDAGPAARLDPAPSADALAAARAQIARRAERRATAAASAQSAAATRDERAIEVAANIATEADAREAVAHGADSVGLLRTELLFLERRDLPDVEEQRAAYQAIVDALGGRRAIIRTLDVGNDKEMPCLPMDPEPNPALGVRGIRTGFARPDLLDTQLRALLAVRPASACRIMLPMIADAGELLRVGERLRALAADAGVTDLPELGVMIEVPSAAILADQLARHAAFLSIGTNDLTQYVLAMDRLNPALAPQLDGLHPAVLRTIHQTTTGAARHDTWVGVCGALASDLEAVPVLIGLGVTELSVSPGAVPEVKARVRALEYAQCRREAEALLEFDSAAAVRARVREVWP